MSTSIVLQPTTIYSTNLVPTTFTLISTAISVVERGLTTTIFTGRTVTTTVTANLLNLPVRAEPTEAVPTEMFEQQSEAAPKQTTKSERYFYTPVVRQ